MSTDICRWLFLLFFLTTWMKHTNSKEIRVVCYYTNWSVYRPGTAKFSPQNINPYLCTHLIYAFGGFTKENTLKPFDKYQDIEKGGYAKFTGLKTYNKNLKTMLAIGGWNEGSSRFSPMVANPDRRKELIKNAIKFLRQNHFDGLDLDWEYPSFRDGGKSRDRDNYAQLVQELREEFDRESEKTGRPRLLLTMAVPAGIEYINKGYDVPKLTKYLDWMNILSYDYHSAFEPAVNHHAPLYPLEEPSEYNYDTELNIDYTIQHYLEKGADSSKLVLGIPTYGRSYTLFNPDANEIGAPADGPGDMGEATRENGYLAYYEICDYIKSQDWKVVQPNPDVMGPYAFKDNQWVGYDDDNIARKKASYVAEKGLGGIMFWSIDNDDFRGNCHGKPYPIIEAAKEALISAYGLTDENLVSPPVKATIPKTRTRTQVSKSTEDSEKKKNASSSGSRRRNRIKTKSEESNLKSRSKGRRKETKRTTEGPVYSSLELVTPSYTTPAPPSTPDQGGGFKCEDEGFYPHPKDCKKYYWCLSGPGELGIIAHQFTCPAGLYFNKAADSCDYTRNVLCNKKLSKSTTTTITTTTTEASTPKTSTTSRVPPRITAATSRTTVFRTSTTTEAYEDEYEYEDDDDIEESKNSEEDPKVIKELLDLIKKAGGIEELEKQLKIHEDGSASVSNSDTTTPPSISKSLVERVLGKAVKSGRKPSYNFLNRNSRGPQNEGLQSTEDKEKHDKGRPQYTTIARQRPRKTEEEDINDKDVETSSKSIKKQPKYVNIRRGRVSTTTEEPEENPKQKFDRNKILGEGDDKTENDNDEQFIQKKTSGPQYVNIRRQRPSTTEETSTSKYTVIRRGTTTEANTTPITEEHKSTTVNSNVESSSTEKVDLKSKYKILRRGSTTEATVEETEPTSSPRRRGTTVSSIQDVTERSKTRGTTVESTTAAEESSGNDSTLKYSTFSRIRSTTQSSNPEVTINSETETPTTVTQQLLRTLPESITIKTTASLSSTLSEQSKTTSSISESIGEGVYQTQTPLLLEPRPFTINTRGPTSSIKPVTESSTRITKVSDSNYKLRVRQKLPHTQTEIVSTTTLTTEKPTPFRTRAPSRFKQTTSGNLDQHTAKPTVNSVNRARKRFSTTTESDTYEEYDIGRTYRPSEIADLSSLTAVDFATLKELSRNNNLSKQRRLRPTAATTTTEKLEESLKTGPKTLPLARKLLDGTTFGKSRRVVPTRNVHTLEDQINSSSDKTHRIRGFTRSSPVATTTTEETTKHTLRNRKVVRRLRPTASLKLNTQNSDNGVTFRKGFVRSGSTPKEAENLIENASSNSLFNRRLTRPTTTALEVNKLSSTTKALDNLAKDNDEQNDDVSVEEGENIKLSESNIRENSNVNNNNHNILAPDEGQKLRRKVLKRIKSKVDDEKVSTEPNIIIRTRKIIRKLTPTESTLSSTSTTEPTNVSSQGRIRKIIRRLKATTPTSFGTKSDLTTEPSATQESLYIRGRPFLEHVSNEKSALFKAGVKTDELIKFKPTTLKSKYKSFTHTTPTYHLEENSDKIKVLDEARLKTFSTPTKSPDTDISSIRTIDRSKYSTLHRGTTSTLRTNDEERDFEEEEEEEDLPLYRIYKPTVFHENNKDEEDKDVTNTSPNYRIFPSTVVESDKEKEADEKLLKPLVVSPLFTEEITEDQNDSVEKVEITLLNRTETELKLSANKTNIDLDKKNDEKDKENSTENNESDKEETLTTQRNYVNPILDRQKNRPAFKRPKITTPNPLFTSTASRPRYRSFSRSTTSTPNQAYVNTNATEERKEIDKKFETKNVNHTKYVSANKEKTTENILNKNKVLPEIKITADNITETTISTEAYKISTEENDNTTTEIEITTVAVDSITINNESDQNSNNTEEGFTITEMSTEITNIDNDTVEPTTVETLHVANTATEELSEILNTTEGKKQTTLLQTSTISSFVNTTDEDNNYLINESTINYPETSTVSSDTTIETTPLYHPKSTLRSFQSRPKYNVPKRLTSTESPTTAARPSYRFNQKNKDQSTQSKLHTPSVRSTTISAPLKNRFIYKYTTTERNHFITEEKVEDEEEQSDYIPEEDSEKQQVSIPKIGNSYVLKTSTTRSKPRVSNRPEPHSFRKTTETPRVREDLTGIDTEAVKNRNKNLFSKKRKMNTPFAGHAQNHTGDDVITATTESTTKASTLTTTPLVSESVTKPSTQVFETTEYLTTLHHVFAETELVADKNSVTEASTTEVNSTNSKVEKLIEVNRIIEVHEMNNTEDAQKDKKIDKIGVINRVTVVKVVDGNPNPEDNEIKETTPENMATPKTKFHPNDDDFEIATVREIPNSEVKSGVYSLLNPFDVSSNREDRKFEVYGASKVLDYSNKNEKNNAEIIDGRSNINVVTPRPYYSTEASTISLEALFQKDTPQKLNNLDVNQLKPSSSNNDDELLETGNSRYVNVRILKEDEKEDDYVTMKAKVVEVTPKTSRETIKIVPIKVEMSRKLIAPSDFSTKIEQGVPKVKLQIIKPQNK